jgi:flagellar hook-associated protein 2
MDPIGTFSGIASGIQWRDMIDQIMRMEARPANALQARINAAQTRVSAWQQLQSRVQAFHDAAKALRDGSALRTHRATLGGLAAGEAAPFAVSVGAGATPGTSRVQVLALASNERLSGHVFASRTAALGVAGEFTVNGVAVRVDAADSLERVAQRINEATVSGRGTGVTASILTTAEGAHRLVLTSKASGAQGIALADAGGAGTLRQLGLLDASAATLRHGTSNGARSDGFRDGATAVGALLGLQAAPAGTVLIGGVEVELDLATLSLDQIAERINSTMASVGRAMTATVAEDMEAGASVRRLVIAGTTSFDDQGTRVLETLGVLGGGRSAVAHEVASATRFTVAGGAAATAATFFSDLHAAAGIPAGAQAGDTLALSGTDHAGNAFSLSFTIGDGAGQDGTTLGDLVERLNAQLDAESPDGATAAIVDGRLVVRANAGGESRLAVAVVAHNEGGGTLDFGALSAAPETVGRLRQVTAGADAVLEIDGTRLTRASNVVEDALPGVTLTLARVTATPVELTVAHDTASAAAAVQKLVDAYNAVADFIAEQSAPVAEGMPRKPLGGDAIARTLRTGLANALRATLAPGIAGSWTRLADLGIEIDRGGRFTVDAAQLRAGLEADAGAVARLLGVHGSTSTGLLDYVTAGDGVRSGSYDVEITRLATRAALAGAGFSGSYQAADPGAPDTLVVTDAGSGRGYEIVLSDGMTTAQIVASLNAEFGRATRHEIAAGTFLYGPDAATPATAATRWDEVRLAGGEPGTVVDGTLFQISGRTAAGAAFVTSYTVPEGGTLGGLRAAVQDALGPGALVSFEDGRLVARAEQAGTSLLELNLTATPPGGEAEDPFALAVTVQGRGVAGIAAEAVADEQGVDQLRLVHDEYGSVAGFTVSFRGDAASVAQLGLPLDEAHLGVDVAGYIGGVAATGTGRTLTGGAGSLVDGLVIRHGGNELGAVGTVTYSRGIAAAAELVAAPLVGREDGSIDALVRRLNDTVAVQNRRIEDIETRLDRRRESLIQRFTAMEQALSRGQAQLSWLTAQIQQFNRPVR